MITLSVSVKKRGVKLIEAAFNDDVTENICANINMTSFLGKALVFIVLRP